MGNAVGVELGFMLGCSVGGEEGCEDGDVVNGLEVG